MSLFCELDHYMISLYFNDGKYVITRHCHEFLLASESS